ncbi:MAG: FAD-binding oxidoreductase [Rhodobacteraceae bacterium]|nr:FAD-binding oxidoreductase [Paracoccaceae bacterium]
MSLNPADESFTAQLRKVVSADVLRPVEPRYLEEPRGRYAGQAGVLALPRTVDEVSALVRFANSKRVGVVPYGGGTGLVGGQVAPDGPLPMILSLERMSAIRAVYPDENILVAEAGAILAEVQAAAQDHDRLFPLSLASEGSARIGGNLSTNAGGVNVLRYGNTRDLCLGLEAVLPDGRIWNGLSRLRKDNTGYDLKNLFVGAEGALGVITAASLKLVPVPAAMGTAAIVVPSPRAALDLLGLAKSHIGDAISAFELINGQGLAFLTETLPQVRQQFDDPPEWYVLIEVGLAKGADPEAALADLFEVALEAGLASDGLIAQSQTQRAEFWSVRENIPLANRRIGSVASHDVSIPISLIPEFINRASDIVARFGDFRVNCFGHLGDGNLHYNIFPTVGRSRADYGNKGDEIKRALHDLVNEMDGSVSAEHGIGRMKVDDLNRYGDPVGLDIMRAIKTTLDPNGIMNPGAVLNAT